MDVSWFAGIVVRSWCFVLGVCCSFCLTVRIEWKLVISFVLVYLPSDVVPGVPCAIGGVRGRGMSKTCGARRSAA